MVERLGGWGALLMMAAAAPAWAADHREAPRISEFPPADIGDLYAFRPPGTTNRLVVAMTVNPLSEPGFAGTYAFSPLVRYTFTFDNDGDAVPDQRIEVLFDEYLGIAQDFVVQAPEGIRVKGQTTVPTVLDDEPNPPQIARDSGVRVFAGPRDDPFFFDGVGFSRFVNGAGTFTGDDSFAGLNVSAIVIELPLRLVDGGSSTLEIAALTTRRMAPDYPEEDKRLDRTGVPAVSTALVPFAQRDAFNRGLFQKDAEDFAGVLVESLDALGTSDANIEILAGVAVPDTLKLDLDQPIGFPNGRALDDDVIDTVLTLVLNGPAGDGVDANDRAFLDEMPYLAPPFQAP